MSAADELAKYKPSSLEQLRETVESVAIAFILAFVFKNFLAEAFVIPTGSMAPTLQGRHFDLECEKCGKNYRNGYSDLPNPRPCCPNCRYTVTLQNPRVNPPANRDEQPILNPFHTVFNGDRIIVNKFLYDFDEPQRWDVIVFKYPHDAKTNYIKRLIGLPGEKIEIQHGDIYVTPLKGSVVDGNREIARKPTLQKLQAMLQEVYDQNYVYADFVKRGWPLAWTDWSTQLSDTSWKPSADLKSFSVQATAQPSWLRYRHFVPTDHDWAVFNSSPQQPLSKVMPSTIKDFYAYDVSGHSTHDQWWVGDLAVSCDLSVLKNGGLITLELVKGGLRFQAVIDGTKQTAELRVPNQPAVSKSIAWSGTGSHRLFFANVDDQLTLTIDGLAIFDPQESKYAHLNNDVAVETGFEPGSPEPGDLAPVGIAVQDNNAIVSNLRIFRDVFYSTPSNGPPTTPATALVYDLLNFDDHDRDQFMMLGDNSPSSADSRYWKNNAEVNYQHYVERRQLMGKATMVFWPHGWPFTWSFPIRPFGSDVYLPFYPNFKRMGRIR